jgi:hypothetical protein
MKKFHISPHENIFTIGTYKHSFIIGMLYNGNGYTIDNINPPRSYQVGIQQILEVSSGQDRGDKTVVVVSCTFFLYCHQT